MHAAALQVHKELRQQAVRGVYALPEAGRFSTACPKLDIPGFAMVLY